MAVRGLGSLSNDRILVEYDPKHHLVILDRTVHNVWAVGQEELYMFWKGISRGSSYNTRRECLPQPKSGVPGTGELTLTFLGEAGVVGRAAMVCA